MVERNHFIKRPPGPLLGFWSWRYLNKWKTFRLVNSKRVRGFYRRFPHTFPPGERFPEIELSTSDGRQINTGDYLGHKHLVLFTGAIT